MIELRVLGAGELADVIEDLDGVMQRAYGTSSFRRQLEWYAAAQPDGFVVAEEGGTIVGTGCAIAYPAARYGWIGLVATDPVHERRGVGRLVTERVAEVLAAHGCASVLDASVAGGPLYARMGFVDHGVTRVFTATGPVRAGRAAVQLLDSNDVATVADVVRFDAEAFGADRRRLLGVVLGQNRDRAAVVRNDDGVITGYVVAQEAVIGPLVATDEGSVTALASFALGLPWDLPPRISTPPESSHRNALEALGFEQIRDLRHMRRGIDALPGNPARIAGRVSLGVG